MTVGSKPKIELRSVGEIRGHTEEGICEAYLTKWNAVDSYRTKFEPGAFANCFETRGTSGIRLFWNHRELAGKILELREDDYGPWAKVKFNLETRAGAEAYAHVSAGDVDCFSFGFNTVKDKWVSGVRSITEVDMLECGPVVFQANDEAIITSVRAEDFNETQTQKELRVKGWQLLCSLDTTIDDIYWIGNKTSDEVIPLVDTAISQFHVAYMSWLDEFYAQYEQREGVAPREVRNAIQGAIEALKIDDLTSETTLTASDVENLTKGKLLSAESRSKLNDLPEVLVEAHRSERRKKVETLCNELREGGFNAAEADRFSALLELRKIDLEDKASEMDKTIGFLKEFRSSL